MTSPRNPNGSAADIVQPVDPGAHGSTTRGAISAVAAPGVESGFGGLDTAVARCIAVGKTYGTGDRAVVAVYDATCTVARRDRIAIIGPSGSGKSTLLHLLAGLETPSAGQISWPALEGHPRDGAHRVGLVFQAPTLIPSMTVLENVELPMLLTDTPATQARERARTALDLLDLDGLHGDLPQELSGGQAQRVVIARVLAARPRLILADEPTSQLDRHTADHVADMLVQVSDEIDAALVVATHDRAIGGRMRTVWPMHDGGLHPATTPQSEANTLRSPADTSSNRRSTEGDHA